MAEAEELEIRIDESGQVTIEVIGATGQSCLLITKSIEEALGIVADRQLKTEFYDGDGHDQVGLENYG